MPTLLTGACCLIWQVDLETGEVLLDLDFTGSAGATSASDASPAARSVTFSGGAAISTAQYVSAPSSVLFTGGHLEVASSNLVLESFTIDFDMYAEPEKAKNAKKLRKVSLTGSFTALSTELDGWLPRR